VKQLIGVQGWLLFLCVIMAILSPLTIFLNALSTNIPFVATIQVLYSALSVMSGVLLWRSKKIGLKMAKITLFVYVGVVVLSGLAYQHESSYMVGLTLGAMVYPAIWFTYLTKSRRVKNTFFPEQTIETKEQ
jgi:drug/metabolite transporter (DMT)-like permease